MTEMEGNGVAVSTNLAKPKTPTLINDHTSSTSKQQPVPSRRPWFSRFRRGARQDGSHMDGGGGSSHNNSTDTKNSQGNGGLNSDDNNHNSVESSDEDKEQKQQRLLHKEHKRRFHDQLEKATATALENDSSNNGIKNDDIRRPDRISITARVSPIVWSDGIGAAAKDGTFKTDSAELARILGGTLAYDSTTESIQIASLSDPLQQEDGHRGLWLIADYKERPVLQVGDTLESINDFVVGSSREGTVSPTTRLSSTDKVDKVSESTTLAKVQEYLCDKLLKGEDGNGRGLVITFVFSTSNNAAIAVVSASTAGDIPPTEPTLTAAPPVLCQSIFLPSNLLELLPENEGKGDRMRSMHHQEFPCIFKFKQGPLEDEGMPVSPMANAAGNSHTKNENGNASVNISDETKKTALSYLHIDQIAIPSSWVPPMSSSSSSSSDSTSVLAVKEGHLVVAVNNHSSCLFMDPECASFCLLAGLPVDLTSSTIYSSITTLAPPQSQQLKPQMSRRERAARLVLGGSLTVVGAVIMASPLHPIGHVMAIGGVGIMGGRGWGRHRERKQQQNEEDTNDSVVNTSGIPTDDSDSAGSSDSNGASSGETRGDGTSLTKAKTDGDKLVEIKEGCKSGLPSSTDKQKDDEKEAKAGKAEEEDVFYDPVLSVNL